MVLHNDIEEVDLLAVDAAEVVIFVEHTEWHIGVIHLMEEAAHIEADDIVDAIGMVGTVGNELLTVDMHPLTIKQHLVVLDMSLGRCDGELLAKLHYLLWDISGLQEVDTLLNPS